MSVKNSQDEDEAFKNSQDEAGNGQNNLQLKARSGTANVFAGDVMTDSSLKLGCNLTDIPLVVLERSMDETL